MLEIQKFLISGGTFKELEDKYGIKAKRHGKYPNLVLFKYDQINSPFGERIVQECRGIILEEANGWRVVCRPFDKFFNHGEGHAAQIDWSTAVVQEKLDGSLCSCYYYGNKWHVATSGTPDASGDVNGLGITFADLFWDTFHNIYTSRLRDRIERASPGTHALQEATNFMFGEFTYMFELMTPYNRIVVPHKTNRLVLIGLRDNRTGQEFPVKLAEYLFDTVQSFFHLGVDSIDYVLDSFKTINPLNQEGYVVVDANFNRIKVKHPGYVQLHRFKDGMSPKSLLDIIRSGETSELLVHFPEWGEMHAEMMKKYNELITAIENTFVAAKSAVTQKEFAMLIKDKPYASVLFGLRAGKIRDVKHGLADMDIDKLFALVNKI